jgi:hypothetical protein
MRKCGKCDVDDSTSKLIMRMALIFKFVDTNNLVFFNLFSPIILGFNQTNSICSTYFKVRQPIEIISGSKYHAASRLAKLLLARALIIIHEAVSSTAGLF